MQESKKVANHESNGQEQTEKININVLFLYCSDVSTIWMDIYTKITLNFRKNDGKHHKNFLLLNAMRFKNFGRKVCSVGKKCMEKTSLNN